MVLGGLIWFIAACLLYWISRKRVNRYVAALPTEARARLSDPNHGLGPFLYLLEERKLLSTVPTDSGLTEMRASALWWRRWWYVIALVLIPPAMFIGLFVSNTTPLSLDFLAFHDFRVGIAFLGAVGLLLYSLRLSGRARWLALGAGGLAMFAVLLRIFSAA
jgi:hypothetical protein